MKNNFISHQKGKSINTNIFIQEFDFNNNLINGQSTDYNNRYSHTSKNNNILNGKEIGSESHRVSTDYNNYYEEKQEKINLVKTIDEMKQNVLDLYYDKDSEFKKKIDDLNLKFYLETEKYLNNTTKSYDNNRNQKLQANLFIILFQQINIYIEEIERLNKIISDNKFMEEKIFQRTAELNEKKNNILLKDNLIQSLKKSNTNTEKKLLETLLHEDQLIKDNERLRKENEAYKTLTIVFENEIKNKSKQNGLTPQKNQMPRHVKTYSDYGVPSNAIINELCYHNNTAKICKEKYETINNGSKLTKRDKKTSFNMSDKVVNKEVYNTNTNTNFRLNLERKNKYNELSKYSKRTNIVKGRALTDNSIKGNNYNTNTVKIFTNTKQKLKQNSENKNEIKKEFSSSNKNEKKPISNKTNNNNINLGYNSAKNNNISNPKNLQTDKKIKKLNIIKKKNWGINLDGFSNDTNQGINSNKNTITETNNLSIDKTKDKNLKKTETKKVGYHKKQKTMSEIAFNDIVRVHIFNDEFNGNANNKKNNNNNNYNRIKIKKNEANNGKKSPKNRVNKK